MGKSELIWQKWPIFGQKSNFVFYALKVLPKTVLLVYVVTGCSQCTCIGSPNNPNFPFRGTFLGLLGPKMTQNLEKNQKKISIGLKYPQMGADWYIRAHHSSNRLGVLTKWAQMEPKRKDILGTFWALFGPKWGQNVKNWNFLFERLKVLQKTVVLVYDNSL